MYIYERYNFRLFTPVLATVAFIFIVYGEVIGAAVAIAAGIYFAFSWQGIKIDPQTGRYQKYDRFPGWLIGKWEPYSRPSYVTIVRINLSSMRTVPSPVVMPENSKDAKAYKVNLVVEGDERYIPICRGPLEKMTGEALRLGTFLGIRVLDYSTHEKKWIP